ncbi:MAG: phosphate ABC transporter substrate-binding protein PstS [Synechococcaceae cyanobacterium RM1_1_27]|nr:phosphate ABC transporter substrate-binding protein PstS [Synechococcaceae cyanobacterium SM2_3_2]NJO86081.1 phosphate ABC transporter substrate-binding protein PstS [Synechococcaceae cyanobacterium RM1_1_27]
MSHSSFSRRQFCFLSAASLSASAVALESSWQQASAQGEVVVNGSGASFIAPAIQRWASEYNALNPNIRINYQSKGSSGGRRDLIDNVVDFACSDTAMNDEEAAQVADGVIILPLTAGTVVVAYNLPGNPEGVRLSRQVLSEIFLGEIFFWDDQKIQALNPSIQLPNLPVTVVYRSDGSGTTATFTASLVEFSTRWGDEVGRGSSVNWPIGTGARGNEGVAQQVSQIPGALGYMELNFAIANNLPQAALENNARRFVRPSEESSIVALSNFEFPDDLTRLRAFDGDPVGDGSYPIVTYSYGLAKARYSNAEVGQAIKDFFLWSIKDGQTFSRELGYIALPEPVVSKVEEAINLIQA